MAPLQTILDEGKKAHASFIALQREGGGGERERERRGKSLKGKGRKEAAKICRADKASFAPTLFGGETEEEGVVVKTSTK